MAIGPRVKGSGHSRSRRDRAGLLSVHELTSHGHRLSFVLGALLGVMGDKAQRARSLRAHCLADWVMPEPAGAEIIGAVLWGQ